MLWDDACLKTTGVTRAETLIAPCLGRARVGAVRTDLRNKPDAST